MSRCIALHIVHSLYDLLNFSDLLHTASLLKGTQPRFRARKPRKTGLITVELQKAFPELNEQLQEEAAVKPGGWVVFKNSLKTIVCLSVILCMVLHNLFKCVYLLSITSSRRYVIIFDSLLNFWLILCKIIKLNCWKFGSVLNSQEKSKKEWIAVQTESYQESLLL